MHRSELPLHLVMKPLYETCETYLPRKQRLLFWKRLGQKDLNRMAIKASLMVK